MKHILFVCTGNLCRSPLAEGYLSYLFQQTDARHMSVSSAGTHALPGAVSTPETQKLALERGFDLSNHRATFLSRELIDRSDLLCVMEYSHREQILLLAPDAKDKTHLLTLWCQGRMRGKNIPDPFMQSLDAYYETMEYIISGVNGLFEELVAENAPRRAVKDR